MRASTPAFLAACVLLSAPVFADDARCGTPSDTEWIWDGERCIKFRSYRSPSLPDRPVLVVAVHGDSPFRNPYYHYTFAETIAASNPDTVAVGILRPGYRDGLGAKSDGDRGKTTGDNYTRDVAESIASAIRQLKEKYGAEKVLLAGHSGGAAISAIVLGLHRGLVDHALLVSCPCDLDNWRQHMDKRQQNEVWREPVTSISPHVSASTTGREVKVTLMVSLEDPITPSILSERYHEILVERGVSSELIGLDGEEHNIFLEDAVVQKVSSILRSLRATK